MTFNPTPIGLACALSLALGGCGGDGADTGEISIAVTDAPVDMADAVEVQFAGVELKPAGGPAFMLPDFGPARRIDLLDLQDGVSELLGEAIVPAGRYNWIRLAVESERGNAALSSITIDGAEHALWVPSDETGLKLVSGFIVPAGGQADFTVDFDLRKSVHQPMDGSGDYVLRPALRLLDNAVVGMVTGQVAASLMSGDDCTVYVFAGAQVEPDDVDGADPDPVTSARVRLDDASGLWVYRAAFLAPGDYTLALTCDAAADDPAHDDAGIGFPASGQASVAAEQESVLDFTG